MKNFVRIPNDLARCGAFSSTEFRVLVILMSMNPCFPSHADLSNWANADKKTITKALKSLKTKGVVSWDKGHGFGKNNRYWVNFKALTKLVSDYGRKRVTTRGENGSLKRLIWEADESRAYSDQEIAEIQASIPVADDGEFNDWLNYMQSPERI